MSGLVTEVEHHDRWCYFAGHLENLVPPLHRVLDIIDRECVRTHDCDTFDELSKAQDVLRYEVNCYERALTTLAKKDFKTIAHETYAMYQDLLKGRMVISNDVDTIGDLVGHCFSDFIECIEVVGTADVLRVDGVPHLVNKRWTAPAPNTMYYDHFPRDDKITLAALEEEETECKLEGWAIRLDPRIIPEQRF